MDWDDIEKPTKTEIVVGENLERLSLGELEARISALEAEVARVKAEIARKKSIGAAAESVFKS